jgi:serine/threonine protein kinase
MEYLKGGELLQTICKRKHYTENDARRIMTQLTSAIKYLHLRKVIHRDLKPENLILVNKDIYSDIKIVDFGYAYVLSEQGSSDAQNNYSCGTPGYMSPEILVSQKYSTAGDIWSLGVILYIIISGTMPFNYRHKDVIIVSYFKINYLFSF